MGMSAKARQNLMWLEKYQKECDVLLSQFIDVIKPMLYNFTNSSLEVSVGVTTSNNGFISLLTSKTNNLLLRAEEVSNGDIKLHFCDADYIINTMFVVNLSCINLFNMEKFEFVSQGFTVYTAHFTYMNVKYYLKLKVKN